MKFFALIMALLVLAQSFMPCADIDHAISQGKEKTEISKEPKQHDENHRDTCSPFCTCSCCAGIAFLSFSNKIAAVIRPAATVYNSMIVSPTFGIPLPIWQPPRLV